MNLQETIKSSPLGYEQSTRKDDCRTATSGPAGKMIPIHYAPILREDRISRGSITINLDMIETPEVLMNAVNVTAHTYFVPLLAFDRFASMHDLNCAYQGVPSRDGEDVIPLFNFDNFVYWHDFWLTMGLHYPKDQPVNFTPVEAYNAIYNHRARARSRHISERQWNDTTLAPAFWKHTNMSHIVPDFDLAAINGEVALSFGAQRLPVTGIGRRLQGAANDLQTGVDVWETSEPATDIRDETYDWAQATSDGDFDGALFVRTLSGGRPQIFAEMQAEGVTFGLSNIEAAKKTQTFAKLRTQYKGIDEQHIIDLLMQGVRVPEEQLSQPILLDRQSTIFGMSKRYATDSGNLEKHVATGQTSLEMRFSTPPLNTGGVVMTTLEVVPDEVFERTRDYYLAAKTADDLPNAQADYIDPEKVSYVRNAHVDALHDDPDGLFGFAGLNHEWDRSTVRLGGKYHKPWPIHQFDEDRQRIWTNDVVNPSLTEDFYVVNRIQTNVFATDLQDPFEIFSDAMLTMVGNTQFGKRLTEDTDDYEIIQEDAQGGNFVDGETSAN